MQPTGIVEAFIRKSAGQCAVADHSDDIPFFSLKIVRLRKPQGS